MARRPRKRHRFLVLVPYLAIVAVLLIANAFLPLVDPSLDIPFTKDFQEDGRSYLEINRGYLAPFFPAGSPMVPELRSSLLTTAKAPGSVRILCLGESSMFGVPFQMAATIPALVRKQLRHLYPEKEIEVINLGASAINSHVIRAMVPEFLSLDPDIVLIYTGHNEFYGPDGIGASWLDRTIPGYTQLKYRLRRQPLVLWFQKLFATRNGAAAGGERNLMKQVSAGAEVVLDSPEAERVFKEFGRNLVAILRGFRDEGVPVVLADVSSNLLFPPFAPHPDVGSDPIREAIEAGRADDAAALIEAALGKEPANAHHLYWRGRLALLRGDHPAAVAYLERARDHDLLKFRAPGRVNAIIREAGAVAAIPVLPVDSLLRARSPRGITDSTFFSEHLHPTFAGYDLIARVFVRAILDRELVRGSRPPERNLLPFDADSLSVPWLDLGFGALGMRALTGQWPFTAMPVRRDALDGREDWEVRIVNDLYEGRRGWTDALLQYAYEAHRHGRPAAMVTALSALVEENPWTYPFRYGLAGALDAAGRPAEAVVEYRRTLVLRPGFVQAGSDLAALLFREGRTAEAEQELRAFFANPASGSAPPEFRAKAYYTFAGIEAGRDSTASALRYLEDALGLAPGYRPAEELRARLLRERR